MTQTLPAPDAQGSSEDPRIAPANARPIPRVTIEAFCDDEDFLSAFTAASADRRLSKATTSTAPGGIAAALRHYVQHPTPDLIVLDSALPREQLLASLDALAEHCDAGTKVVVCGRYNDVLLYRELLKRGVSEYLVTPVTPHQILESVSNLYNDPNAAPIGNVVAFVGAKGGVGSSTICHNTAWCLAEVMRTNVVIADLDLAFGTTGLDFNQDPVQGIADALSAPDRFDQQLLDRLLTKCTPNLSIFAAPVMLDREWDLDADACQTVLDVVRRSVPFVVVDLPHLWTAWSKRILQQADEIVITAEPDLANLRNVKNLFDLLKQSRPNDALPHVVFNKAGMPKRPELPIKDFCANIGIKATSVIEFDAEGFGQAANNGQMIEEVSQKSKSVAQFREIAHLISHRKEVKAPPPKSSPVASLLEKLKLNF
jgi:pilus assembly protein CpaE